MTDEPETIALEFHPDPPRGAAEPDDGERTHWYRSCWDRSWLEVRRGPADDGEPRDEADRPLGGWWSGRQVDAAGAWAGTLPLMVCPLPVPDARQGELDEWYDTEHTPILMAIDGWHSITRYARARSPRPADTRLALHELEDVLVLGDRRRLEGRNTPWRQRLVQEDWFPGPHLLYIPDSVALYR